MKLHAGQVKDADRRGLRQSLHQSRGGDDVELAADGEHVGFASARRTVPRRARSPRAAGHVKTLTPPGPTKSPRMMSDDPEHELSADRCDDAGDDEDDGENPQHRGHETSKSSAIATLRSVST